MEKTQETNTIQEKLNAKNAGQFYTITILILVASIFFVSLMISIFAKGADVSNTNWYRYISYSLSGVALFFAIVLALRFSGLHLSDGIGSIKFKPIFLLVAFLMFFGMIFGLGEANNLVIKLFEKMGYTAASTELPERSFVSVSVCIVCVCLIPAVLEELIFRGFILKSLQKYGNLKAILISAVLFSFYHMSPEKTLYQFIVGLLFALLTIKSKSLIPGMIVHFFNNFIVIINYYFVGFVPNGGVKIALVILGLISLGVALFLMLRKKIVINEEKLPIDFFVYGAAGMLGALIIWISAFFTA